MNRTHSPIQPSKRPLRRRMTGAFHPFSLKFHPSTAPLSPRSQPRQCCHPRKANSFKNRLSCLLAACWIGFAPNLVSASPDAPAVLFLEEDDAGRPGYVAMINGFRQLLEKTLPGKVAIYVENLDLARFSHPEHHDQTREWFRQKYRGKEIDVVVASGPASMKLAGEFREEFWPDARMIGVGFNPQQGKPGESSTHVAWLTVKLDAAGTLDAARVLMPDASRLVVVVGAKSAYAGMNEFILREAEAAAARHGLAMESLAHASYKWNGPGSAPPAIVSEKTHRIKPCGLFPKQ